MHMELQINVQGVTKAISRKEYIQLKHEGLVQFGYNNLTVEEVETQLDAVLEGKEFGKGLNIIGMFIQKDEPIVIQAQNKNLKERAKKISSFFQRQKERNI